MEKVSSDDDEEHIAGMRGLLRSRSSLKRSTTSSPIHKTYSRSRVSSGPSDAGIRKRVKFSVSSTICELEPMRNGPLPQNEGTHLAYIDGAKTSEFKSFKRLLEKTTHKHYFDEVVETDIKLKKCKAASSKGIQSKSDVRSSSLPVQYGSSILQDFLSSSSALVLQKHEFKNNAEGNNGAARSLPEDQLLHPSPLIVGKSCGEDSVVTGTIQQHKGTFSLKRACLLQLATCGTHLQNVDDFLSNRSDFILEILQRLGIKRNPNKNEKLQNSEQKIDALQLLAPSKRSNHIVEFCDNYSQENSPTYESEQQYANLLGLTLDNTKIQAFPYNHSLKACSTLLPDFDEASLAIELIEEFDCRSYSDYTDKAHPLLSSRCDDVSDINVFPIDYATHMRQSYHFNETLDCKELFDLCATKLEEEYCSSHGASLGKNHEDSFHADCILFDNSNSENFFREQLSLPLLEWNDATAEKELPALKHLVPKDMDKFTESQYDDAFDSPHEIGSSSFFDVYERKSYSFLTELQF